MKLNQMSKRFVKGKKSPKNQIVVVMTAELTHLSAHPMFLAC